MIKKYFFIFGLFLLPFVFWPWAKIPYEVPKVWFFQRWVEILGLLSILAILKGEVKEKKDKTKLSLLILIFILLASFSSLLGVDRLKSLWGNYYRRDGLFTLFHLAGLFYFIHLFWEKSWEKPTCLAIFMGSLGISLWRTPFGNPVFLAGYLLVCLPFVVYFAKEVWFLVLIQSTAIVLTGSTAGTFGILFYLGLILTKLKRNRLIVLGVLSCLVLVFFAGYQNRLEKNQTFPESRQRILVRGVRGFLKRPILGWGVANFDYALGSNFWPAKFNDDVYVDKAHGNLLEVLVTTGILGLLSYIGIILAVLAGLKKNLDKTWGKILLFSFLLFLFHSQTNVLSINEEMFFWLIAGIASSTT